MMASLKKCLTLMTLFVLSPLFLWSQTPDPLIQQARTHFAEGNYTEAAGKLSQASAANPQSNAQVATTFSEFGEIEFNRRNFRNAYSAFREALKLQPTNQTATQYYLKMRREMDVANLKNEYVPPVAVNPDIETTRPVETGQPTTAATETTLATRRNEETEDLKILIEQLKAAEGRLNSAEVSVSSTRSENDTLKRQLEAQRIMVEKMLNSQTRPTAASSSQDNLQLQETIRLLSLIAENDAQRTIVVQPDPTLQVLVQELNDDRIESQNPFSSKNIMTTVLVIVLLILLSLVVFFLFLAFRHRKSNNRVNPNDMYRGPQLPMDLPATAGALVSNRQTPMLEYSGAHKGNQNKDEVGLRAALMRADHLQRMYEDVRTGNLNWDTIRSYTEDLEKSLKIDILKVVEARLDSGSLFTAESALPILFPFLTDFDDYISEKANELAKTILVEAKASKGSEEGNPLFGVQALMGIAQKLEDLLKNKDRTLTTSKISLSMAKVLGLSKEECEGVYKGALAHDAGYLMLEKNNLQQIISKPDITEEEWKFIQDHVKKGIEYFEGAEIPDTIRDSILYHHERNDGSGYPFGLKNEEIPLCAKIIGVAETFASLVSSKSYRDKLEVSHALAVLKDGARKKFDKTIVDALEKIIQANGGIL